MDLSELCNAVENQLDVRRRIAFLLDVGRATLPALRDLPDTINVINDAFAFAHGWNSGQDASAGDLYEYANRLDETGLAFEELKSTTGVQASAIGTCVFAYYYAVWCAYVEEGAKSMPEDVECVPYEVFPAIFQHAIASDAVSELTLKELLARYLAADI